MFKVLPTSRLVETGVHVNKSGELWMTYGAPGWPWSCSTTWSGCVLKAESAVGPGAKVNSVSDKGGNDQLKFVPAEGKFVVAISCKEAPRLYSAA